MTLSAQGSQSVTGTAVDKAGNSASVASPVIKVDTTPPTLAIGGIANGGMYYLGNVPNPTCSATDSTSGLAAACSGQLSGGLANGVGTYTYTANAVDLAGNTTTLAYTFRVIYRFDGFLQPINDTAHQVGLQSSQFKAGAIGGLTRDYHENGRASGLMAARVMRGEQPGAIPFEGVSKTKLIINDAAVRALGLTIPAAVLKGADLVIGK